MAKEVAAALAQDWRRDPEADQRWPRRPARAGTEVAGAAAGQEEATRPRPTPRSLATSARVIKPRRSRRRSQPRSRRSEARRGRDRLGGEAEPAPGRDRQRSSPAAAQEAHWMAKAAAAQKQTDNDGGARRRRRAEGKQADSPKPSPGRRLVAKRSRDTAAKWAVRSLVDPDARREARCQRHPGRARRNGHPRALPAGGARTPAQFEEIVQRERMTPAQRRAEAKLRDKGALDRAFDVGDLVRRAVATWLEARAPRPGAPSRERGREGVRDGCRTDFKLIDLLGPEDKADLDELMKERSTARARWTEKPRPRRSPTSSPTAQVSAASASGRRGSRYRPSSARWRKPRCARRWRARSGQRREQWSQRRIPIRAAKEAEALLRGVLRRPGSGHPRVRHHPDPG